MESSCKSDSGFKYRPRIEPVSDLRAGDEFKPGDRVTVRKVDQ